MKLICPECRRENEPERIYCHDCGARLDRSALAKGKSKEEAPQETHRRLKTMFDPRGVRLKAWLLLLTKVFLGALAAAALVQMLRTPDLPPPPETVELPVQINLDLEGLTTGSGTDPLRYTEAQVNAYLGYVLKGKRATLSNYLNFERGVAFLKEGSFEFTAVRSLFGLPVLTSASYSQVRLADGKITAQHNGGAIGRLPVHPSLMQFGNFLFADVWKALERERRSIAKLGGLEIQPQAIVFLPKQP